jgi:hypothetical protein
MFNFNQLLTHIAFTFAMMQYQWAWLAALFASSISNASPTASTIDKKGAVASESAICSNIGIELLKRGVST